VGGAGSWDARAAAIQQKVLEGAKASALLATAQEELEASQKSLLSKEKEAGMLRGKLEQFEALLSKGAEGGGEAGATGVKMEEVEKMQKENKMLNEAIEVLHGQVDEYESEIKTLKGRGGGGARTPPRRSSVAAPASSVAEALGAFGDGGAAAEALRGMLRESRMETNRWKAKVLEKGVAQLLPLRGYGRAQPQEGDGGGWIFGGGGGGGGIRGVRDELQAAREGVRLAKASVKVISLGGGGGSAARKAREERERGEKATRRLEMAVTHAKAVLAQQ
jgi:hypothetical protein